MLLLPIEVIVFKLCISFGGYQCKLQLYPGGICMIILLSKQSLFSVSRFPSRAGGFEKLFKVTWNMEYSIRNINYVDFVLIHWRSYEEESAYST